MTEFDIDLLVVFDYLLMLLCFKLIVDGVFLWLGFIGFVISIVALVIIWYMDEK